MILCVGVFASWISSWYQENLYSHHFLGACTCHDCSNILKHAVPKLNPNLTSLYASLHSYLGGSMTLHRRRQFEAFCNERGMKPHRIPKYIEVRFTTITTMAEWLEKDHRCLYLYFTWLLKEIQEGKHQDISAAEQIILREFLSRYLETRLDNMFLLEVTKPILHLIKHFEAEDPRLHERFEKISTFLYSFMSKFLKNAG